MELKEFIKCFEGELTKYHKDFIESLEDYYNKKEVQMKTIKYRIYDPMKKRMIESGATPMMLSSFFKATSTLDTVFKMKYQQFIGLLDKNKKEMYEGDIIKYPYGEVSHSQVRWVGHGFWVKEPSGYIHMPNDREIIGNVCENPELL